MRYVLSKLSALVAVAGVSALVVAGSTLAQDKEPEVKQIKLSDQQVTAFIAAQKDHEPLAKKLSEAGEEPDAATNAELEAIAKKHGFADYAEFGNVGDNIAMVLYAIDPETGKYVDPVEQMKQDRKETEADTKMPEKEKKEALADIDRGIAEAKPLEFKENIDVVSKHRAELETLLIKEGDAEQE